MTRKKYSFSNWILDIVSLPVLVYQTLLTSLTLFKKAGSDIALLNDQNDQQAEKKYQDLAKKFTPATKEAWRNYVRTGLAAQLLTLLCGIGHLMVGNWVTALQIGIVFIVIYVCFGYRAWILRKKRMVSFFNYCHALVKKPLDGSLINSTSLMDI